MVTADSAVWLLLRPSTFLFLLAIGGQLIWWTRFARLGWRVSVSATVVLLIFGLTPASAWLMRPLEERFPRRNIGALSPKPDALILLGGGSYARRGRPGLVIIEIGFEATSYAVYELAATMPDIPIIYTRGSAIDISTRYRGLISMRLCGLCNKGKPIAIETASRGVSESSRWIGRYLADSLWSNDRRHLLVALPYQMPRAIGAFRKDGVIVEPWPVDRMEYSPCNFQTFDRPHVRLLCADLALFEWSALLGYWLRGESDELFPGPTARAENESEE